MVIKARTIIPVQEGQKVIGYPYEVEGFTPLAKLKLPSGDYAVLYKVDDPSNPVVKGELDLTNIPDITLDVIRENADTSITDTVASAGNYVTRDIVSASTVADVGGEIEGIKVINNKLYVTVRYDTRSALLIIDPDTGQIIQDITLRTDLVHAGGTLYIKNMNKLIIPVSGTTSDSDTYIYLFDVASLTAKQVAYISGKHLGGVVDYYNSIAVFGDWDTINICSVNIVTGEYLGCETAPSVLNKIQDADLLGITDTTRKYAGLYQFLDNSKSIVELYQYDGSAWKTITGVVTATPQTSGNPPANNGIGLGEYGYVAENNLLFKTKDLFVPIIGVTRTTGDKFNIGLSRSWPMPDSAEELISLTYDSPDWSGWKIRGTSHWSDTLSESDVITGDTIIMYHWEGQAIATNGADLINASIGLPGGLLTFGVQTWGSSTEDFSGEAYLIKAIPFVTITEIPPPPPPKKSSRLWIIPLFILGLLALGARKSTAES